MIQTMLKRLVRGSKSAKGGPYPLADLDRWFLVFGGFWFFFILDQTKSAVTLASRFTKVCTRWWA